MNDPALTNDRSVLAHLKPINMQIWIDDSSNWGVLGPYRWNLGMSDYAGAIVYDYKKTRMGDLKTVNEEGAIVFPRIMVDGRGGAITIVGTRFDRNDQDPIILIQSARFGRLSQDRLLFQVGTVRASETTTNNSATNKATVGGKAGLSYGIGSGEVNGSYEHGSPNSSQAETAQGRLVGLTLVWVQK